MHVSVVGCGKLGLPASAFFASKGHEVTALDVNALLIERLRKGECPIEETDLAPLLKQQTITFTSNFDDVTNSEIIFVIVPTPSDTSGRFSNEYVLNALKHLREYEGLVVITSTVMPGSCEKAFKPLLLRSQLCYGPEFIALGTILRDMSKPDVVLIGEDDKASGDLLERFHRTLYDSVPICRMSWENAEVAKLALNVFVTTKLSLINTIAEACEKIPKGNVDEIANFLGHDSRIGPKYLVSGVGFGGPCFPRDNSAFVAFAKDIGINHQLQTATDDFNNTHWVSIVERANELCKGDTVSILGLTYKPFTNVVEESRALKIAEALSTKFNVRVHDPEGMNNAKKILSGVTFCASIPECLHRSDLCVIATPWDEFKTLTYDIFRDLMRRPTVLDCWRILNSESLTAGGVDYLTVGVNSD